MTNLWLDQEIQQDQAVQQPPIDGLWAAQVSRGADESTDLIYVVIPDYDAAAVFGPARWPAIGDLLPARGDKCLVGVDNQSNIWVIVWVPA